MKIAKLTSENIMRLTAVEIEPDAEGNLVIVAGDHGSGKTSVLRSIEMALGGAELFPPEPLRRGAKRGKITLKLAPGDITIERTFTADGGTALKVTAADGAQYKKPQAMLDALWGARSFDPMAFANMKPGDQLNALKRLLGLDFSAQDAERKRLYDQRTVVNRDLSQRRAQLLGKPGIEGVPAVEVSIRELATELDRMSLVNEQHAKERARFSDLEEDNEELHESIRRAILELERLRRELVGAKQLVAARKDQVAESDARLLAERTLIQSLKDEDTAAIRKRMADAEDVNRDVRQNIERAKIARDLVDIERQSESLTDSIDAIDQAKKEAIAAANFPVDGLGFSDAGITVDGFPFEQINTEKQIRISVAMGLALNPKLPVMLIRDGDKLYAKGMALIAELAKEADAQFFIERSGEVGPVSFVIEDGAVAQPVPVEST